MNLNDFFASLYELGGTLVIGQNGEFSFDLFLNSLYSLFGTVALLSVIISLILFYFAINHPGFNRWYHMALVVIIISFLNGVFVYVASQNTFDQQGITYGVEYLFFSIVNFFFVMVSFSVFIALFRLSRISDYSRNCSTCPFPN
jgi:hypothetical protein